MGNKIVSVIVIVIIIVAGIFLFRNKSGAPEIDDLKTGEEMVATSTDQTASEAEVKEFTVEGANFSFVPNVMNVKLGDTVRVTFKNVEGAHDWRLDEFGAKTNVITAGKEETIEFVADKVGSFEYYCSIGEHRARGMVGTLTVAE